MKRLLLVCIVAWFTFTSSMAQLVKEAQYLFPSFQAGLVYYKSGQVYNAQINFSLVTNKFVFIDTTDHDVIKEFAEPDNIGAVKIGERLFVADRYGSGEEVLKNENPRILVRYKGKLHDRGQKAAYGGRSLTSSIESVSSIQQGGTMYQLEGDDRWVIQGIEKRYKVEKDKKMKEFVNEKQFLKIFSKKKETLQEYIQTNNVDFDNIEQVMALCQYADALE
ncbi:hypothetical protein M2480_000813 [Parabacteroides sp. PFB2-12]|uniref:hypothetical protein n=1 Tax=unclassified Parabacteroides TaxID=2649774 RepID=UPI002474848F|nr:MULTISPECIES: hypothetical protein [unclassified Parabacteroides]MDH6341730.1 hypothetical protein [Parabacteroides sp. PM6-13]MDH6389847.1 hypothetical protein [Parabacteroides sp. PFB2-12]